MWVQIQPLQFINWVTWINGSTSLNLSFLICQMTVILTSMLLTLNETAQPMAWPTVGVPQIVASIKICIEHCSSRSPHRSQKVTPSHGVGQQALSRPAGGTAVWGNCYGGRFDKVYQNNNGCTLRHSKSTPSNVIPGMSSGLWNQGFYYSLLHNSNGLGRP